jgi:hypothetical protein
VTIESRFLDDLTYSILCILLNEKAHIQYQIMVNQPHCPNLKCLSSNSHFVVSTGPVYELWDLQCSRTTFQCNCEAKSKDWVCCWELRNGQIERLVFDPKAKRVSFVSDQVIPLPYFESVMPTSIRHLTSETQNLLLFFAGEFMYIAALNGTSFLRLPIAGKPSAYPAVLQNDLLVLTRPSESTFCIFFDGLGRVRASFAIPDCFVDFVSDSSLRGTDTRDGTLCSFEFNATFLCADRPELAFLLLHFSVLGQGAKSRFLEFLTTSILERFWRGQLFDEYFLVLMRTQYTSLLKPHHLEFFRTTATTFCRSNQCSESIVPIWNAIGEPRDWPDLIAKHPEIFYMLDSGDVKAETLAEKLLKIVMSFDTRQVPSELCFPVSLQLIALQARLSQNLPIPQHFGARVVPGLSSRIREFWEVHRIVPVAFDAQPDSLVNGGPQSLRDIEERWWKLRNEPEMKKMKMPGLDTGISGIVRAYAADKINTGMPDAVKKLYRTFLGVDMGGADGSLFHELSAL